MSTEQDKNKSILDDEKFIDDLYARVNKEVNEQPSSALDQTILAAAHKSVNVEFNIIDVSNKKANEKANRVKTSKAWYIPVGIAASTVLAVSLVINQSDEVFVNSQSNSQFSSKPSQLTTEIIHSSTDFVLADNEVTALLAGIRSTDMVQEKEQTLIVAKLKVEKLRRVEERARSTFHAVNKEYSRETAELSIADEMVLPEKKISSVEIIPTAIDDNGVGLVANLSQSKLNITPWLSTSQYQLFLKQGRLWSPMEENDTAYLIHVFASLEKSEQVEQYSVSKETFKISVFTDEKTKRYSFKQIKRKASH